MDQTAATTRKPTGRHARSAITEPLWFRWLLIGVTLLFLGLFLVVPLAAVFHQALARGWAVYGRSLVETDALSAIRLTLLIALIVVPINTVFGVAAAWAIAKFQFVGKSL
jgi:sulfate transport system permease protein